MTRAAHTHSTTWSYLLRALAWLALCVASHAMVKGDLGLRFSTSAAPILDATSEIDDLPWRMSQNAWVSPHDIESEGPALRIGPGRSAQPASAFLDIKLQGPQYVRFTANVSAGGIEANNGPRDGARVVLVRYDTLGRARFDRDHVLTLLHGDSDQRTFEADFRLEDDVQRVQVGVINFSGSGCVSVHAVKVQALDDRAGGDFIRGLLKLLWCYMAVQAYRTTTKNIEQLTLRLSVLAAGIALVGCALLPKSSVSQALAFVRGTTHASMPIAPPNLSVETSSAVADAPAFTPDPVRKMVAIEPEVGSAGEITDNAGSLWDVGHLLGFATLAFLLSLCRSVNRSMPLGQPNRQSPGDSAPEERRYLGLARVAWSSFTVAVSIEVLQLFSPERAPSASDVAIDIAGISIGIMAGRFTRGLFK